MHTRIVLERMEEHGTTIRRVINGGGIPQRNPALNQVYANVLNKPVLVTKDDVTSLGSVIFAFLACGEFASPAEAQDALCPAFTVYTPQPEHVARAEKLYQLFRSAYFALGTPHADAVAMGRLLPELRIIRRDAFSK